MRRLGLTALAGLSAIAVLLVFAAGGNSAGEHGLGGSTNCTSPTRIADPVFCTYTLRNNSDDFGDTQRAHTVIATAQTAGGTVSSGNIFSSLRWVFTGSVTCVGGSGLGTS